MIIIKTNYGFKVYILDDEWVVEYPDLKVVGTGETFEEAFEEALKSKKAYLKYLSDNHFPIPKPSSFDKSEEDVSGKVTLRMSKSTHRTAILCAQEENVSLNSYLNEAIINHNAKKIESYAVREIINMAMNYKTTYIESLKDVSKDNPSEGVKA